MNIRWLLMILYGLFVIWTGLARSVEAQAFKPNAFWFCLLTGLLAIAAGYALKAEKQWFGRVLALTATLIVLGYYTFAFISEPESDASTRVALVIIASIGSLCVVTLPRSSHRSE